jgi:hypothetical protein
MQQDNGRASVRTPTQQQILLTQVLQRKETMTTSTTSKIVTSRSIRICSKCEQLIPHDNEYYVHHKNGSSYKLDYCMTCIRTPEPTLKHAQDDYQIRYGMLNITKED